MEEPEAALYALEPGQFIKARDELAERLKADGDREGASRVKQLRRPTVAAWGVNLLARERPDEVEALLESGERLRSAHEGVLQGADPDRLRESLRDRREAMSTANASAVALLTAAGRRGEPHTDDIQAILAAALHDPAFAEAVRSGTVSGQPAEAVDLPELAAANAEAEVAAPPGERVSGRVASARRALQQAREEHEQLQDEARARGAAAESARTEADRAATRLDELEAEVIAARRTARDREREADRAEREATAAAKAESQAAQKVEKALERLDRAEEEQTA